MIPKTPLQMQGPATQDLLGRKNGGHDADVPLGYDDDDDDDTPMIPQ